MVFRSSNYKCSSKFRNIYMKKQVFPKNIVNFFSTDFSIEHLWWLFLNIPKKYHWAGKLQINEEVSEFCWNSFVEFNLSRAVNYINTEASFCRFSNLLKGPLSALRFFFKFFKNDEKCFLFYLKNSFYSHDI